MGTFYRNPHTTQERRINGNRCEFIWVEDYCIKCRPSRSMALLIDNWDERIRTDYKNRSWKEYRKTQYKVIKQK